MCRIKDTNSLRLIAREFIDNQTEKLIGFAALVKPAEMFAAIAAARSLPDVIFKPRVFVGGGAADIATWGKCEAAD